MRKYNIFKNAKELLAFAENNNNPEYIEMIYYNAIKFDYVTDAMRKSMAHKDIDKKWANKVGKYRVLRDIVTYRRMYGYDRMQVINIYKKLNLSQTDRIKFLRYVYRKDIWFELAMDKELCYKEIKAAKKYELKDRRLVKYFVDIDYLYLDYKTLKMYFETFYDIISKKDKIAFFDNLGSYHELSDEIYRYIKKRCKNDTLTTSLLVLGGLQ